MPSNAKSNARSNAKNNIIELVLWRYSLHCQCLRHPSQPIALIPPILGVGYCCPPFLGWNGPHSVVPQSTSQKQVIGVWLIASRSYVWALGAREARKVSVGVFSFYGGKWALPRGVSVVGWGFPKPKKGIQYADCLKNDDEVLLVNVASLGLNGMEMWGSGNFLPGSRKID